MSDRWQERAREWAGKYPETRDIGAADLDRLAAEFAAVYELGRGEQKEMDTKVCEEQLEAECYAANDFPQCKGEPKYWLYRSHLSSLIGKQ